MRIVQTVGQAFDVCHQLILQQKSEDKEEEEEERKAEEEEPVQGCSSTHTHRHTHRFAQMVRSKCAEKHMRTRPS